jgi:hypothetical protein
VFTALSKTERLQEVFAISEKLVNVVLLDADAELALHSLISAATTAAYVTLLMLILMLIVVPVLGPSRGLPACPLIPVVVVVVVVPSFLHGPLSHVQFVTTLCCNRLQHGGQLTPVLFVRLTESAFAIGSFDLAVDVLTKVCAAAACPPAVSLVRHLKPVVTATATVCPTRLCGVIRALTSRRQGTCAQTRDTHMHF